MDRVVKRPLSNRGGGWETCECCSDELVETRTIETMRETAVNVSTEWVSSGTLLRVESAE